MILPESFELPDLPRGLYVLGEVVGTRQCPDIPPAAREGALRALEKIRHLVEPAPREVVAAWLMSVNAAVSNPISENRFQCFLDAAMFAGETTPGAVWSGKNLRLGLMTWKFWPSLAEIFDLFKIDAYWIIERERKLCLIAGVPTQFERLKAARPVPARLLEGDR